MIQSYQQGSSMLEELEKLSPRAQAMIDEVAVLISDSPPRVLWEYVGAERADRLSALAAELLKLLQQVVAERDELQNEIDSRDDAALDRLTSERD